MWHRSRSRRRRGTPALNVWDGYWHYAAGTYDGSAIRLYVDGSLVGSTGLTAPIRYGLVNGDYLGIGAPMNLCGQTSQFNGAIDEVRVWGRALTAAEIMGEYVRGVPQLAWPDPPSLEYGEPVSSTHLNASTDVPGVFSYAPPMGATFPAGTTQTLSTHFEPADAAYLPAAKRTSVHVVPAPLSIRANDMSRAYGEPNATLGVTYEGFVLGEGSGVLSGSLHCVTGATQSSAPGAYSIVCSGLTSTNYAITWIDGTLTVTPAPQTITFGPLPDRTYGEGPIALSATASSGLPVTFLASGPCFVAGSSLTLTGAGECTVTAAQAGDGNWHPAPAVTHSLIVGRAHLTVTAQDAARSYGAPNPLLGATYAGFVNGDGPGSLAGTLTCSTTATPTSGVAGSPYPITCSGLSSPDYAITWTAGSLAVTRASLTVTPNDTTKLLGAPTTGAAAGYTVRYAGFANGESAAVLPGALVVAPTTPVSSTVPGVYVLRASGLASPNYAITYVDGALTVIFRICLLYEPTKVVTGSTIPIKLYLCDTAGSNLSRSTTTLTALEIDRGTTRVASASGAFTFSAKLTSGGGYQYNVSTRGLTAGQRITYTLRFRVSTDPLGVNQGADFILR